MFTLLVTQPRSRKVEVKRKIKFRVFLRSFLHPRNNFQRPRYLVSPLVSGLRFRSKLKLKVKLNSNSVTVEHLKQRIQHRPWYHLQRSFTSVSNNISKRSSYRGIFAPIHSHPHRVCDFSASSRSASRSAARPARATRAQPRRVHVYAFFSRLEDRRNPVRGTMRRSTRRQGEIYIDAHSVTG